VPDAPAKPQRVTTYQGRHMALHRPRMNEKSQRTTTSQGQATSLSTRKIPITLKEPPWLRK